MTIHPCLSGIHLSGVYLLPAAFGEINPSVPLSLHGDRRKKDILTKHILVFQFIAYRIRMIIEKHRSHDWLAFFRGNIHVMADIGAKLLPQPNQIFQDLIVLFPEAPDFVMSATAFNDTRMGLRLVLRPDSGTVESHHRAEQTKLRPSHNQLSEILTLGVTGQKSSDITVPPGYPTHGHGKSGLHAHPQRFEAGHDIAVPDQGTEFLGTGIGSSGEQNDLLFSLLFQTVIKHLTVIIRVQHCGLGSVSRIHLQIGILLGMYLRLRLIQPEIMNSLVIIILLHFIPHKGTCLRMRHIDKSLLTVELKHAILPILRPDQHVSVIHLPIILTLGIDGRPDRYHRLHSHFLQLPAHAFRVRPVLRIEFPLPLLRPMEEVNDDSRNGHTSFFILPHHLQHFLLTLISESALPEACCPSGEPGGVTRKVTILFQNLCGRFSHIHQIVCLICTVSHPHGMIPGGFAPPGSRIIPEESVTQGRIHHRYCGFGIIVLQVAGASLSVKDVLLLLPQSVKMLSRIRIKDDLNLVMIPLRMYIPSGIFALKFGMQYLSVIPVVGEKSPIPGFPRLHLHGDSAVHQNRGFLIPRHTAFRLTIRLQKSPFFLGQFSVFGGTASDTIPAIGFHYRQLIPSLKNDPIFLHPDFSHSCSSFRLCYISFHILN